VLEDLEGEFRRVRSLPPSSAKQPLVELCERATRLGATHIACGCLFLLSLREPSLSRRALLQRRIVTMQPSAVTWRALATTERDRGHFAAALRMLRRALALASSNKETGRARSLEQEVREMEAVIRQKDSPMHRRAEATLCNFALWEWAEAPRAAEARLWRYRWSALRDGNRRRASVFLGALVNMAIRARDESKERRLARRLVRESRTPEAWHMLSCAEERSGNSKAAYAALQRALRSATREGDAALRASLRAKLDAATVTARS
jgi:hypothetical protein